MFISCNNTFEVYDTKSFASGQGLTTNYGEANPVIGVHKSLVSGDDGSVTYVHYGRRINRVSRDPDTNEIIKEIILNLNIPLYDEVTDAYVMDEMVAV